MYNKYDEFTDAIENPNYNMTARVKIKAYSDEGSGSSVSLSSGDFISNSITITEKASSNSDFCVGGCCIGTFDFTLSQKGIKALSDEGLLKKGTILKPVFYVNNSDDDRLSCKLGCFTITDIDNNDYKCQVQSSDYMLLFDKEVTNTDLAEIRATRKNVLGWLEYCCTKCSTSSIALGVGNIGVTTNMDVEVTLPDDKDISTFRDLIGWLSIFTASFATINRNGKLILRQFQTDDYDYSIPASSTFLSSKFDMLVTRVAGYNTSVAGFDKCFDDSNVTGCNRAILSIEEIPFLRELHPYDCTELDVAVSGYVDNIYNAVKDLEFIGGTVVYSGNPAIELGDTVKVKRIIHQTNSDDYEKESAMMLVTGYVWKFQGSTTISSASVTDGVAKKITSSEKKTPSDGTQAMNNLADSLSTITPDNNGNAIIPCNFSDTSYTFFELGEMYEGFKNGTDVEIFGVSSRVNLPSAFKNIELKINYKYSIHVDDFSDLVGRVVSDSLYDYKIEKIRTLNEGLSLKSSYSIICGTETQRDINFTGSVGAGSGVSVSCSASPSVRVYKQEGSSYSTAEVKIENEIRGLNNNKYRTDISFDLSYIDEYGDKKIESVSNSTNSDLYSCFIDIFNQVYQRIVFKIDECSIVVKTQPWDKERTSSDIVADTINSKASNSDLQSANDTISSLQAKIDALETRIAQLESKQS